MRLSFSILVALVFLLTLVSAHAVPNMESARTDVAPADFPDQPAFAGDDTYYCGYLYKEKGLRGDVVELPTDTSFTHTDGGQSAIISKGCSCAFYM
jgi:hypothetical protein